MTTSRTVLLAALVAGVVGAAGCGGDDAPPTAAEAKAQLSKDCQNGKTSDKPLCDCIADRLEAAGNDAAELVELNDAVKDGKTPDALTQAATACATR